MKHAPRETSLRMRREVFGPDYVDRAALDRDAFNADLQDFIVDVNWAGVWSRDILSRRELMLVTLTLLATLGRMHEFETHFRNAVVRVGVPVDALRELLTHLTLYLGLPAAVDAFRVARRVLAEEGYDAETLARLLPAAPAQG